MRGGGGQKMSVLVHAQGMKTVHAGRGGEKWQNFVHVVIECPPKSNVKNIDIYTNSGQNNSNGVRGSKPTKKEEWN